MLWENLVTLSNSTTLQTGLYTQLFKVFSSSGFVKAATMSEGSFHKKEFVSIAPSGSTASSHSTLHISISPPKWTIRQGSDGTQPASSSRFDSPHPNYDAKLSVWVMISLKIC